MQPVSCIITLVASECRCASTTDHDEQRLIIDVQRLIIDVRRLIIDAQWPEIDLQWTEDRCAMHVEPTRPAAPNLAA
jgi:hypothetical protein